MAKRICMRGSTCDEKECLENTEIPDFSELLSRLPDEMLLKIFSYLNPQDLVFIEEGGNYRYAGLSLSLTLKTADFTQVNTVTPDVFSAFFSKERVQHLRVLNFNSLFLVKSSDLVNGILKCKKLTELSVIHCGVKLRQIMQILNASSDLEKLSWSPRFDEAFTEKMFKQSCCQYKLRKLNLVYNVENDNIKNFKLFLRKNCIYGKEVFAYNSEPLLDLSKMTDTFNICCMEIKVDKRGVQILNPKEKEPRVLYFTEHTKIQSSPMVNLSDFSHTCRSLSQFTTSFCDISALCLETIHMEEYFSFSSLHCLKSLKILKLPSCIFLQSTEHKVNFKTVIVNCENVEEFSLTCCHLSCSCGPTDKDLIPICQWKRLRCLTLKHIKRLRLCDFLRGVATGCLNFKSLQIEKIGHHMVCHYVPSVCYMLKNCKQLKFISIHQTAFYPMSENFWESIAGAENLHGICLQTQSPAFIENKAVLQALERLPFLHYFHLFGGRYSQNLGQRIRAVWKSHKVECCEIILSKFDFCPLHECFIN